MDINKFYELLPAFKEKFLYGKVMRFSRQAWNVVRKELAFYPPDPPRPMGDNDLYTHFCQKPKNAYPTIFGAYGVAGLFEDNQVRWITIDCDNQEDVDNAVKKAMPVLDSYDLSYVMEWSGNFDRGHLWIMVNCEFDLAKALTKQILEDAQCDFQEIYPIKRDTNVIRMPGGYHLKNKKCHPCEYKGVMSSDPLEVMKMFIDCPAADKDKILSLLRVPVREPKQVLSTAKRKPFVYKERNLPLPDMPLPPQLETIASNCQAINEVITETIDNDMIDKRGGMHHMAGLYLNGVAKYIDSLNEGDQGEQWFQLILEKYRSRDPSSHNWGKTKVNPSRSFASCEKWERDFDKCKGCPFKKRSDFTSPKQFIFGKPLKRKVINPAEKND